MGIALRSFLGNGTCTIFPPLFSSSVVQLYDYR
nr:unnamed protein product [Callosobruchus analis]